MFGTPPPAGRVHRPRRQGHSPPMASAQAYADTFSYSPPPPRSRSRSRSSSPGAGAGASPAQSQSNLQQIRLIAKQTRRSPANKLRWRPRCPVAPRPRRDRRFHCVSTALSRRLPLELCLALLWPLVRHQNAQWIAASKEGDLAAMQSVFALAVDPHAMLGYCGREDGGRLVRPRRALCSRPRARTRSSVYLAAHCSCARASRGPHAPARRART